MPRANRRRDDLVPLDLTRVTGGTPRREAYAGGQWWVRTVTGQADRSYRCPGCQQLVTGGGSHVVVWPADGLGGVEDRRHWHQTCWRARAARRPLGSDR